MSDNSEIGELESVIDQSQSTTVLYYIFTGIYAQ